MAYTKSREEIIQHYKEQKAALEISCKSYDEGNKWEAPRLATAIYSLVHDGGRNSRSILTQLGVRGSLRLPSPGGAHPNNLLSEATLVSYRIKGDGTNECLPLLGDGPPNMIRPVQFLTWWEKEFIFRDGDERQLNRKGLVFSLRNQDGGSHVDAALTDEAYIRLAKINISTPSAVFSDQGEKPFVGIAQASMRHVAWELMKGLDELGDIT